MRGFLYLGLLASSLLACTCTAADIKRYSGLEKRDGQKEWIIRPKNGTDTAKLKDTEANIKKIAAVDHVYSYTDINKNLRHWLVAVTDSQLDSIKADDGVSKVAVSNPSEDSWCSFGASVNILRALCILISDFKTAAVLQNMLLKSSANASH